MPTADEVRDLVAYVNRHRADPDAPFEIVVGGVSEPDGRDLLGPLIEAGATWWNERRPIADGVDDVDLVFQRIVDGPPQA